MSIGVWAINILAAVFYITDAPKHNRTPWRWVILTILFGFLPLGIYLVKTERKGWGTMWIVIWSLEVLILLVLTIFGMASALSSN